MKHLCLTRQTILFETWNNIVSSGKQPCWRSETLQLAIRYINLHSFTSSLSRKATIATVLFCTVIRSGNIRNNTLPGDSVSKRKHIPSERHQSGFGELPEKGFPGHHLAFWRKDGHCGAIRLTECHFVTSDSGEFPLMLPSPPLPFHPTGLKHGQSIQRHPYKQKVPVRPFHNREHRSTGHPPIDK